MSKIYTQCVVNQDTQQTKDIIIFYNEVYLKQMKQYVLVYKETAKQAKQEIAEMKLSKAQTPSIRPSS